MSYEKNGMTSGSGQYHVQRLWPVCAPKAIPVFARLLGIHKSDIFILRHPGDIITLFAGNGGVATNAFLKSNSPGETLADRPPTPKKNVKYGRRQGLTTAHKK